MPSKNILRIKRMRFIKNTLKIAGREILSPLTDRFAVWTITQLFFWFWFAGLVLSEESWVEELTLLSITILSVAAGSILWVVINFIRAPFIANKEESELGFWDGHRFVFHSPYRVAGFILKPEMGRYAVDVDLPFLEKNSFAQFKIQHSSQDHLLGWSTGDTIRFPKELGGLWKHNICHPDVKHGTIVPDRKITCQFEARPNADPIHVTLLINYWEIQ